MVNLLKWMHEIQCMCVCVLLTLFTSRFLDKAAVVKGAEIMSGVNPWRLCPVSQIEELKRLLLLLPIWFTNVFLFLAVTQMTTYNVIQVRTSFLTVHTHATFTKVLLVHKQLCV